MNQKSNVVVIKVQRNSVGDTIPFDKLYLFRNEDKDLISKFLGYALVLPVTDELVKKVLRLKPKAVSHLKQYRDDETKKVIPQIANQPLDGRIHSDAQITDWWKSNVLEPYDIKDRVVAVPILTRTAKKRVLPRYLASKKWFDQRIRKSKSYRYSYSQPEPDPTPPAAVSEFAYLATPKPAPKDKITPICSICPRFLLHFQGKCTPGQIVCYKSLDFSELDKIAEVTEAETPAPVKELPLVQVDY